MMQTQVGQLMKANVAAVPALASRGALEDSPVLQNYYRQQYRDQQAAAHASEQAQAVIGGHSTGEPAVVKDYRMTGPRGPQAEQRGTLPTEVVGEVGDGKRGSH